MVTIASLCYNHRPFLPAFFEGVLSQRTDFPIRLVVMDDASTDGSAEVIARYTARYPDLIVPVYQQKNLFSQGQSQITETLVPLLRENPTPYVAFCECDDFWTFPDKLQRQMDFLEKHPRYSSCFHHFTLVDAEGKRMPNQVMFNLRHSRPLSIFDLLLEPQIQTATSLVRSGVLLDDPDLQKYVSTHMLSDVAFFLACRNAGKVFCFREWWSAYRIHNGGISRLDDEAAAGIRHGKILRSLESLYAGRYRGLERQWHRHLLMRDKLSRATHLRRDRNYVRYSAAMLGALLSNPRQFLTEYYKQWQ